MCEGDPKPRYCRADPERPPVRPKVPAHTRARRDHAFTLIELLVVVAVVSVLMGLLLPALGRARRAAFAAECASNIRQLQLANDLYATDHDDRFMPGAAAIESTNLHRWHGTRRGTSDAFGPRGAPITPYLDAELSQAVRACPSFVDTIDALAARGLGFERGCGGYGYNNAYVGVARHPPSVAPGTVLLATNLVGELRPRFAAPARTVAFADAALAADEVIEYSFVEPPRWPESPDFRPDPSVHFRHEGRGAVAWLDGHVSFESLSDSHASGLYPTDPRDHHIGWFGDVSSNALFAGR